MKLVADESVDGPIVERLRRDGHSVESIAERSPGVDDHQVLKLSAGVVLVRLSGLSAEQKAELVAVAIASHGDALSARLMKLPRAAQAPAALAAETKWG